MTLEQIMKAWADNSRPKIIPYLRSDDLGQHYVSLKAEGGYKIDRSWHDIHAKSSWAKQQLKNWNSCEEVKSAEWRFNNKKDAEKFITLYSLRWG